MTKLAFVDTETTGLDPDRHEIWEVGLILRDEDGAETEHEWQLDVDLAVADPIALNIGRFHDRRSADLAWAVDFAREFAAFTRDAHLVGAVVSFDAERLYRLMRVQGECPMWHYHLVDVEALAAGWLAAGHDWTDGPPASDKCTPPWRSDELSAAVGVDPEQFDRHTALGDARWARAIYDAVMGPGTP